MPRPTITCTRAIAFERTFHGTSDEPEHPRGSRRGLVCPFETEADKLALVKRLMRTPKDFEHFFEELPRVVQVVDAAGGNVCTALRFGGVLDDAELCGDCDLPVYKTYEYDPETDDGGCHVSMTFDVSTRAKRLELATYIEAKLFAEFTHYGAHVCFTGLATVTPGSVDNADGADANASERGALRATADALFEHKESMPEAAYLAISGALKRSFSQI